VWLKVPRAFKIHMPINMKDVKRYHSRPARLGGPANETVEPIIVDGEEPFKVEDVCRTYAPSQSTGVSEVGWL